MIDLHCHYLPGIDDGPETLAEALALARAAVADGITHAVLTSHVHPGRYPNQRRNLLPAIEQLCRRGGACRHRAAIAPGLRGAAVP
jgi:protein-tyrosine phosphatase